jgi:hypothetical protein
VNLTVTSLNMDPDTYQNSKAITLNHKNASFKRQRIIGKKKRNDAYLVFIGTRIKRLATLRSRLLEPFWHPDVV